MLSNVDGQHADQTTPSGKIEWYMQFELTLLYRAIFRKTAVHAIPESAFVVQMGIFAEKRKVDTLQWMRPYVEISFQAHPDPNRFF
ncbi:unnamed protein product [Anisakis simplex]|uniref:Bact_transglu_N domain-containing protein n=1 Tax=Anisakis simplex TaxID=6269 RepID=A0A0M3J7V9_ANISI|nr:unnamed protein product [Anisakis simplex]